MKEFKQLNLEIWKAESDQPIHFCSNIERKLFKNVIDYNSTQIWFRILNLTFKKKICLTLSYVKAILQFLQELLLNKAIYNLNEFKLC